MRRQGDLRKACRLLGTALAIACTSVAASQTVIFVDDDAPPGGDGDSWETAYRFLQDALARAGEGVEIRAAEGVYQPDRDEANPDGTGDREATFTLAPGIVVTGGYLGLGAGEEEDPDDRDIARYATILSGDLLGNDGPDFERYDENSYTVVRAADAAVLDGLTITAGNADGKGKDHTHTGAGLFNEGGRLCLVDCTVRENRAVGSRPRRAAGAGLRSAGGELTLTRCAFAGNRLEGWTSGGCGLMGTDALLVLTDCVFTDNVGGDPGAAIRAANSDVTLIGCTFTRNAISGGGSHGGAIHHFRGTLTMHACRFDDNRAGGGNGAGSGGAIRVEDAAATMTDCEFNRNVTAGDAAFGGAIYLGQADLTLVRCTFRLNQAVKGGALHVHTSSTAVLRDCTFEGNLADENGGAINAFGVVGLVDCVLRHNRAEIDGGAIWFRALASLTRCELTGNVAAVEGGAVFNGYLLDVADSMFTGNAAAVGGGIASDDGELALRGSVLQENDADVGGALYVWRGEAVIEHCDISRNTAALGAGVFNDEGTVRLATTSIGENHVTLDGGGLYNDLGDVTLDDVTLDGNTSGGGGAGLYNHSGAAALNECRIRDNRAAAGGGGIRSVFGSTRLSDCILTGNRGQRGNRGPASGGAVHASWTDLELSACVLRYNGAYTGGAIRAIGGTTDVRDSVFDVNLALDHGGAIDLEGGEAEFDRCLFLLNIARGGGYEGEGGAIRSRSATLLVTGCDFRENRASLGGAVFCQNDRPEFRRSTFVDNEGQQLLGDAIYCFESEPVLVGCEFVGGKVTIWSESSDTRLVNCLVSDSSYRGVVIRGGRATFTLCTLTGNSVGIGNIEGEVAVSNCVIWGNDGPAIEEDAPMETTVTYSNVQGGWPGAGNIDADPLFVDPEGNFRLRAGSPCIDAADNDAVPDGIIVDFDGLPRFVDDPDTKDTGNGEPPIVDMGAYEFQVGNCPADLDGDGEVGFSDLLAVVVAWGNEGGPEDLDESGVVDIGDILIVLSSWGPCE